MNDEPQIGLLISNIIDENRFRHCRLCLENIPSGEAARFSDMVVCWPSEEGVILENLLCKIFGDEVKNEIPGIDAVCSKCLKKIIDINNFIQQFELNTLKLHNILDNLNSTLSVNVKSNQVMYITCNKQESKLILIERELDDESLFNCKECKHTFINVDDISTHNRTQHNLFTCRKCLFTSSDANDITYHLESIEQFECEHCTQIFCTSMSLDEHVERTHNVHICLVCGKSYKGLDKFKTHEEKHVSKNDCPKCGKSYLTKDFYDRHVKLCMENSIVPHPLRSKMEKNHVCTECGKAYKTAGGLRVHKRFVHGNAKPHVCTECGKKFTAPCLLKAHGVTHTKEKNFPCDICKGRFVTKEALLSHIRRHTGEKPYPCDQCSESFVNGSARADHIKFKHIGPTLSCDYCSKKFVTKTILRNHMKKHCDPMNKLYTGRADVPHNIHNKQTVPLADIIYTVEQ